jgi:hypothetical protein
MQKKIRLQIPKPCHEDWSTMDPTEQGRFCQLCKKEVVDFTAMSDKEVLNYFSVNSPNICGRMAKSQINRSLAIPAEPRKIWWKYWMGVAASLLLFFSKSQAQQRTMDIPVIQTTGLAKDTTIKGKICANTQDHKILTISGKVVDDQKAAVAGAVIRLLGSNATAVSNESGKFVIKVDGSKTSYLSIGYLGYVTREIKIKASKTEAQEIIVALKPAVMGLKGDIVVVEE